MRHDYYIQRMNDALDDAVGSEVVRIGRCRSRIRGTRAQRERTKMLLLEMRFRPDGLPRDRREIR